MELLEYISQSNDNTDFMSLADKFKFLDDLSILEIINLLMINMSSYDFMKHVPSDAPLDHMYVQPTELMTDSWLENIQNWTIKNKMRINEKKTKCMIFNFTKNHKFFTRLSLNGQNIETINNTKLLGTIISDDFKWDLNTEAIIKQANASLEIIRRLVSFNVPRNDLRTIYILFVRSILEKSAVVWHSGLTDEERCNIERVQKSAFKLILRDKYIDYESSLKVLDMESLDERRKTLCLNFALKCTKHEKAKHMFPQKTKSHRMNTRNCEKFQVQHSKTERLQKSPIIYMQTLLNDHFRNAYPQINMET